MFRLCLIAVLAGLLTVSSSWAAPQKGKKKAGLVTGTVVEVKKQGDKEEGSIVVKVGAGKKKNAAPAGEDKTFKVTSQTKIEKVSGKKNNQQTESVKFSAIEKDARVAIKANGDTAEEIKISAAKKAKKKKKNAN